MLQNHNVLRRTLAAGTAFVGAGAIALGARLVYLNHEGTEAPSLYVTGTAPTHPDGKACRGLLGGLIKTDGKSFRVTGIEGGTCAPIYDPTTLASIGQIGLSDPNVTACRFATDKPARLNITLAYGFADVVHGDVNLTPAGEQAAIAAGVPSCESLGTPDDAYVLHPLPPMTTIAPTGITA